MYFTAVFLTILECSSRLTTGNMPYCSCTLFPGIPLLILLLDCLLEWCFAGGSIVARGCLLAEMVTA